MHCKLNRRSAGCAVALFIGITQPGLAQKSGLQGDYRIVFDKIVDSGGLGELAIDAPNRKLYGAGLKIVDLDHDSVVGSVSPNLGHGYAFADALGRGVTRRGVIFDLKTGAIIRSGGRYSSHTVAYDIRSGRAAINFDSLMVLDVKTATIVGVLALGRSSYVVSDGKGRFLVGLASDTLVTVDAQRLVVVRRAPIPTCKVPAGMTVDPGTTRVFVSCENHMLVIVDYASDRLVASMVVGTADQMAFDRKTRLLFAPTENDTLAIIHQDGPATYRIVDRLPVGPVRPSVALDAATHAVYLVHFGHSANDSAAISLMKLVPGGNLNPSGRSQSR